MNSISASVRAFNRTLGTSPRILRTPTRLSQQAASRRLHLARPTPPTPPRKHLQCIRGANQCRHESTRAPRPLTDVPEQTEKEQSEEIEARKAQEPAYEMTFTCRKCLERSKHRITKQAYHFGTTLVTCPGCKNRHLISDNLKIFSDKNITLEDIMREKGQYLKKGRLGADGDIEFYEDTPSEPKQT